MTTAAWTAYMHAVYARRALVIGTIKEAHERCPGSYSMLRSLGAEKFIIDYCKQQNFNMVLQTTGFLLHRESSVEQMYLTLAAMVRMHQNHQVALDAHAAAKAILREFLAIANSHATRRQWGAAGIRLSNATEALIGRPSALAGATRSPLPA
jgi:hypothetical protein